MRHLSTNKYGQKDDKNVAPSHRSMFERVASWSWQSIAIGTIIGENLSEVYSCGEYAVSRIWNDLGIV